MYHHIYGAIKHYHKHGYIQVDVPYDSTKHSSHKKFHKQSKYLPICTNDSLIFQRKFYLDIGKTYFVFYDFNSEWSIDITLSVQSSIYHALYNFEESYCSNNIHVRVYNFKGFFINCKLSIVKLTEQVPVILQWARDTSPLKTKSIVKIGCFWPGRMDIVVDQNYRNLGVFNSESQMCTPISVLHINRPSDATAVSLGTNTRNQSVPGAVSLIVAKFIDHQCPYMDQSSYTIAITPIQGDSRCFSSHIDFSVISRYVIDKNEKVVTEGCVSLDAIMTRGTYAVYIMEPYYNIPLFDKWIYYSLIISDGCYRSTEMKVYFRTITSKQKPIFHFEFSQQRYHYIWYDYGIVRVLKFHLERFLLQCAAYVDVTSSPYRQKLPFYNRHHFKVLVNKITMS